MPRGAIVRTMQRLVFFSLVGLILGSCGRPSVESTLPRAIETHLSSLRSTGSFQVATHMTRGYVWNRAHQALAARCGVQLADPAAGELVSHYCYSQQAEQATGGGPREGLRAVSPGEPSATFVSLPEGTQTRSVVRVLVPQHATSIEDLTVEVTTEHRTRAPGGEPSEWLPFQPDASLETAIRADIARSAGGTRTVEQRDIAFEESPQVAIPRLQGALMPYAVHDVAGDRLETDWRTTRETLGRAQVLVRSRIRILFDSRALGTGVVVVGQLQHFIIPEPEDGQAPVEPTEEGWIDLDATRIVSHAVAAISNSLHPVPLTLPDEPTQTASSPPPLEPPLADPVATWEQGGLPSGVYPYDTAPGTGQALYLPTPTDPAQVLGIVLDEQFRPTGGRVAGLGASVQDPGGPSSASWHRLQTDAEWSAGADFFGLASIGARGSSTATLAVFSSVQETARVRIGQYVRFDGISANARYFIEAVGVGRAIDVAIVLSGRDAGVALAGSYDGIGATFGRSTSVRSQDCHIRARGMGIGGLDCGRTNSRELMDAVARFPQATPVPVRFYLRRIPDALIASAPRFHVSVDTIQFDARRGDDGVGDRPQIEGTIATIGGGSVGLSCSGSWNEQSCIPLQPVEIMQPNYAIGMLLVDIDPMSANEELLRGTYDLSPALQRSTGGQQREDVSIGAQRYTDSYNGMQISGWYRVW